jgi:hypothetical protein
LKIKGIPAGVGRVLVEHYRIDGTHSNAYTVWQQMGSPQQPTTEMYKKLKADEGLQMLSSPKWLDARDGSPLHHDASAKRFAASPEMVRRVASWQVEGGDEEIKPALHLSTFSEM